jgi:uncharacterized protein YjbI with pentapeptide repeats
MASKPTRGPKAKRPKPLLLKPLQMKDWPGLFGTVGKAWAAAGKADVEGAFEVAAKALGAVGFKDDPAGLAWLCVQRALARALRLVVTPLHLGGDAERAALGQALRPAPFDAELAALEVVLDQDFFDRPLYTPYVRHVGRMLRSWLVAGGTADSVADQQVQSFYQAFVATLEREWQEHAEQLKPLLPANRETPFTPAADEEFAWAAYGQWLLDQSDRQLFEEDFGVRRVYVPLRTYTDRAEGAAVTRTVGTAGEMLDHWLEAGRADDDIRIVEGDPGAGKSTLARVYAADRFGRTVGGRRWRVVFVPLHHPAFEEERPLDESVTAYCQEVCAGLRHPLDRDAPDPTLLVLDGLDELSRGGHIGVDLMRSFVNAVCTLKDLWNHDRDQAQLLVLVCGRPIAADVARRIVRRTDAVINVLPFVIDQDELKRSTTGQQITLAGQTSLLNADQREAWWEQYSVAKGRESGADVYALIKENAALTAVTAQPLLNYLVALVRQQNPDRALPASRFDLYYRLVRSVWERRWGRNRVRTAGDLSFPELLNLLEELAVAAWQEGNIREIRVAAVRARLNDLQREALATVERDTDQGLLRLMLAFFTRPRSQVQGDEAYEFTHKSFAEFLVASRLAAELDGLAGRYARPELKAYWSDTQSLMSWVDLCGPSPIDGGILAFVRDAAKQRASEQIKGWQDAFAHLLAAVIQRGMPMVEMINRIRPQATFTTMTKWAVNAEGAMVATLSVCADAGHGAVRIPGLAEAFEAWSSRRSIRLVTQSCGLGWLDLTGANLYENRLSDRQLWHVRLSNADLVDAWLIGTDLTFADLTRANLLGARLLGSQLVYTNLSNACLVYADFAGATMYETNLSGADLSHADLRGTRLNRTNISGAIVQDADLTAASIDIMKLATLTTGDPAFMPDGKPPAKNWRKKATPRKPAVRKPKATPAKAPASDPPPAPET